MRKQSGCTWKALSVYTEPGTSFSATRCRRPPRACSTSSRPCAAQRCTVMPSTQPCSVSWRPGAGGVGAAHSHRPDYLLHWPACSPHAQRLLEQSRVALAECAAVARAAQRTRKGSSSFGTRKAVPST